MQKGDPTRGKRNEQMMQLKVAKLGNERTLVIEEEKNWTSSCSRIWGSCPSPEGVQVAPTKVNETIFYPPKVRRSEVGSVNN